MTPLPCDAAKLDSGASEAAGPSTADDALTLEEGEEDDCEFEMWVETDLDHKWCLDGSSAAAATPLDPAPQPQAAPQGWRETSCTSTLRRRWDDFEALGPHANGATQPPASALRKARVAVLEALDELGLPFDASPQDVRAAFKNRALECHPDKGGSVEEFLALRKAFEDAARGQEVFESSTKIGALIPRT